MECLKPLFVVGQKVKCKSRCCIKKNKNYRFSIKIVANNKTMCDIGSTDINEACYHISQILNKMPMSRDPHQEMNIKVKQESQDLVK